MLKTIKKKMHFLQYVFSLTAAKSTHDSSFIQFVNIDIAELLYNSTLCDFM